MRIDWAMETINNNPPWALIHLQVSALVLLPDLMENNSGGNDVPA